MTEAATVQVEMAGPEAAQACGKRLVLKRFDILKLFDIDSVKQSFRCQFFLVLCVPGFAEQERKAVTAKAGKEAFEKAAEKAAEGSPEEAEKRARERAAKKLEKPDLPELLSGLYHQQDRAPKQGRARFLDAHRLEPLDRWRGCDHHNAHRGRVL